MVGSVLAFHRIPTGARKLLPADIDDLRVLVEREVARRDLGLSWQSGIAQEVSVAATETRQIALNLLLNACQASPPGSEIKFRASIDDGPGGLPEFGLEVMDSGPGLPPAAVEALTDEAAAGSCMLPRGIGLRVIRDPRSHLE